MNSLEGESALTASSRAALAEYLEELARRIECGEKVTYESEVAAHADFAGPLHELWPALQLLVSLGKTASTINAELNPPSDIGPSLGEFRILSELGRGGMGVVYEAEQGPLGRHVALKVLPFAAVLDQRQLTRFQNEARAAASLHHTNIVPVFSVGCDRGRHYYAMQLIRGRSLEELVRERRERKSQPAPRVDRPPQAPTETVNGLLDDTQRPQERFTHIARLGIQAAEALHCAHENGVVHRDVKPSNLLIDTSGKLWVADFGLARLGGDVGVTLTGDMLGTLRYMSPEQAAGMPAAVDHRTDIYSLGATLYELATERPVVQGQDRAAMLREIAETDPAPPRKYTPSMPADLETILLKCLAKEPSARYDTAQALADDLRRFLENKPVVARRPSWTDRTGKWSRRHRALLTVSTAALLLTTIAASTAALISWRSYTAAQEALEAEARARHRAEANLAIALEGFNEVYNRFVALELDNQPRMTVVQRDLMIRAVHFYEQLAEQNAADLASWPPALQALLRAGEIHERLGDFAAAERSFRQVLDAIDHAPMSTDPAAMTKREHQRIIASERLGDILSSQGRLAECEMTYRRASTAALDLLHREPNDATAIRLAADTHNAWGDVLREMNRNDDAWSALSHAKELREGLVEKYPNDAGRFSDLGATLHNLSMVAANLGSEREALTLMRDAVRWQKRALDIMPSRVSRDFLHNHYQELTYHLRAAGDVDGELEAHASAIATSESLVDDYPDEPHLRSGLSTDLYDYSTTLLLANRPADAAASYRRAVPLLDVLVAHDFQAETHRRTRAMCNFNIALIEGHASRFADAERTWRMSLADWDWLREHFSANAAYHSRAAATCGSLARIALNLGRWYEAKLLAEKAVVIQKQAIRMAPDEAEFKDHLAQHQRQLKNARDAIDDHVEVTPRTTMSISGTLSLDLDNIDMHGATN